MKCGGINLLTHNSGLNVVWQSRYIIRCGFLPTQTGAATATKHAASLSGGSKYCVCHTDRSRGQRRPSTPQAFLKAFFFVASAFRPVWPGRCIWALSVYRSRLAPWTRGGPNHGKLSALRPLGHGRYRFATASARKPFWRLQVLRLPHRSILDRRCSEAVSSLASGPRADSLPWFDSSLVQGVSRLRNTDEVQYTQRPGHLGQMALEHFFLFPASALWPVWPGQSTVSVGRTLYRSI